MESIFCDHLLLTLMFGHHISFFLHLQNYLLFVICQFLTLWPYLWFLSYSRNSDPWLYKYVHLGNIIREPISYSFMCTLYWSLLYAQVLHSTIHWIADCLIIKTGDWEIAEKFELCLLSTATKYPITFTFHNRNGYSAYWNQILTLLQILSCRNTNLLRDWIYHASAGWTQSTVCFSYSGSMHTFHKKGDNTCMYGI